MRTRAPDGRACVLLGLVVAERRGGDAAGAEQWEQPHSKPTEERPGRPPTDTRATTGVPPCSSGRDLAANLFLDGRTRYDRRASMLLGPAVTGAGWRRGATDARPSVRTRAPDGRACVLLGLVVAERRGGDAAAARPPVGTRATTAAPPCFSGLRSKTRSGGREAGGARARSGSRLGFTPKRAAGLRTSGGCGRIRRRCSGR